jgi:hypothetical protein
MNIFKTKRKEIVVKRILITTMIVVLFNSNISAANYYQSLCSAISGLGKSIENVNNVPVIGKLTNVLPMAVLAASLKECPMQTMMVLAALGGYIMSQNPVVQEMMSQYEFMNNVPWMNRNNNQQAIDENIFVFDGEDDNDASEDNVDDKENEEKPESQNAQQVFL